jgi:hypothetical protein
MNEPDPRDDTSRDYERFETEQLARDQDAASVSTGDLDDETASNLGDELLDAGIVTPVPEARVLVHEPSDTAFDSTTQLAVFHRGWTSALDADETNE